MQLDSYTVMQLGSSAVMWLCSYAVRHFDNLSVIQLSSF